MKKTFYLIDGHSQIFRAYFAPFNVLTAPSGEPVKATYLFTQMVLAILRDKKPDYIAMALDVSDSSTRRAAIYPEYKAHRDAAPEDLPPQVERIVEIMGLLGIPIFRQEGYEADDLIATIAAKVSGDEVETYIVSRDKDLYQLLSESVKLWDPVKDEVIDPEVLERTHGFRPQDSVEIQTLMGDAVDNVPGVPGVGPKTAVALIQKYGTVENVVAHIEELKPRLRENLGAHAELLAVSRKLVTLDREAPVDFRLEECVVRPIEADKLRPIFERLSFRRLVEQLGPSAPPPAPTAPPTSPSPGRARAPKAREKSTEPLYETREFDFARPPTASAANPESTGDATGEENEGAGESPVQEPAPAEGAGAPWPGLTTTPPGHYTLVDTPGALEELARKLAGVKSLAIDTETTGLKPVDCDVVGISLSWSPGEGYYLPLRSRAGQCLDRGELLRALKPLLEDPAIAKRGQNIKFDLQTLRTEGVEVRGVDFDSMVASYLLRPEARAHNMDSLAMELLGHRTIPITDLIGKGKQQGSMLDVDTHRLADYAGEDADITWQLCAKLEPEIEGSPMRNLFREVEMPLVEVLADMEYAGVRIDCELLRTISAGMRRRIEDLRQEIYRAAGRELTIDSPKQLAEVLFDEQKLRVVKRTKTARSTDAEVLEVLAVETGHPLPGLVLQYRELMKLCGTYVEPLPELVSPRTGRLHASFHQTIAATGRLSSSDPNIQNIPIRSAEGREIRRAFVPGGPDLALLTADYSQIELRILAHLSGDPALVAAFEGDQDIHAAVAAQVWGVPIEQVSKEQRSRAKAINFGIIYGQGAFGLARSLGISQRDAADFIAQYRNRYKGIVTFMDRCVREAEQTGRVSTLLGRQRAIPEIHSENRARRALGERLAINTVVQGTAADLIKVAMVRIHRKLKDMPTARLLIQVHDELVFEVSRARASELAELVRAEMTGAMSLRVPLRVDVAWGDNWLDAK